MARGRLHREHAGTGAGRQGCGRTACGEAGFLGEASGDLAVGNIEANHTVKTENRDKQTWLRPACLAIVSLAAVIAVGDRADAASRRNEGAVVSVESRVAGDPIMAIVSLRDQRITIYDANGWILRAPVSSGQKGRETPAGIFSVIEKQAEHYSNLYDDASMPHMQRITWSGIALHGGHLPGYPASHGCIRMPFDFAERLFDATQ